MDGCTFVIFLSLGNASDGWMDGCLLCSIERERERERERVNTHSRQTPFTHAFVMEFASEADRDYYAAEDPAHLAYKKSVRPLVEKVNAVDYTPGVI